MAEAHETWNGVGERLEQIEARIHDRVPLEQLLDRASRYVDAIAATTPIDDLADDAVWVEIGPGVGYIMQAFAERTGVKQVTGVPRA